MEEAGLSQQGSLWFRKLSGQREGSSRRETGGGSLPEGRNEEDRDGGQWQGWKNYQRGTCSCDGSGDMSSEQLKQWTREADRRTGRPATQSSRASCRTPCVRHVPRDLVPQPEPASLSQPALSAPPKASEHQGCSLLLVFPPRQMSSGHP